MTKAELRRELDETRRKLSDQIRFRASGENFIRRLLMQEQARVRAARQGRIT